jgi:hypothetical protein
MCSWITFEYVLMMKVYWPNAFIFLRDKSSASYSVVLFVDGTSSAKSSHNISYYNSSWRCHNCCYSDSSVAPRGVPEVDECGIAEIGNSKEETCGTQFR